VLGARVPVILTSRADSLMARLASCAVAAPGIAIDQSVPISPDCSGAHGSAVVVQYISIFGMLPPPKGSQGPRHQPLPQRSQR